MAANAPNALPKLRSEPLEHGQLLGVAFDCVTPTCRGLSWTEGKGPKEAQIDTHWSEIACVSCGTRYLIEWPASDGNSTTIVQRILTDEKVSPRTFPYPFSAPPMEPPSVIDIYERIESVSLLRRDRTGDIVERVPIPLADLRLLVDKYGKTLQPPLSAFQVLMDGTTYSLTANDIEVTWKDGEGIDG